MTGPSRPSRGGSSRPHTPKRGPLKKKTVFDRKVFGDYGDPEEWRKLSLACRQRDGWRCQECNKQFAVGSGELQAAHIIARSKRGPNTLANLKSKCVRCHSREHPHMQRLLDSNKR